MFLSSITLLVAIDIATLILTGVAATDYGQKQGVDGKCRCRPANYDGIGVTLPCDTDFVPDNCDSGDATFVTVEDFERCGPARVSKAVRNYFLGAAGRRITYNENKDAFKKIRIVPKLLRDVSKSSLDVKILGKEVAFPIGLAPIASHNLILPEGELATAAAVSTMNTVMILSGYSSTRLEDVAKAVNKGTHLWMQTYIFKNKTFTEEIIHRAENAGFEAIVVTVDSPVPAKLTCSGRNVFLGKEIVNLPEQYNRAEIIDSAVTYRHLNYMRRITKLPIIAKGVLSAVEAKNVIRQGVSGILVSNHGGRQLDSDPATIDVLPDIVEAAKKANPLVEVYLDGGVRNGWDVYKAIASGAKMVFVGRPIIWGLAVSGENGVRQVMDILKTEFEQTMKLAGASSPSKIERNTLRRPRVQCRTEQYEYEEENWTDYNVY